MHSPCHLDHCWQKEELCMPPGLCGRRRCNPRPPAAPGPPWQQQHASTAPLQRPLLREEERGKKKACQRWTNGNESCHGDRQEELTGGPSLPGRHPLVAPQVVEEYLFIVALFFLVVDVHVATWEQNAGRKHEHTQGESKWTAAAKTAHRRQPCSFQ